MSATRDTICALATGAPPSAIALIRLSGPDVRTIATKVLREGVPHARRAVLDTFQSPDGETIDSGLMVFMPGPNSFTGEDTLECSLHGGRIIVERALEALFEVGARLAEPGEFTRRAFEAGKLDLTQAEAIADLIEAESEAQHRLALNQLDGALSRLYERWRDMLTQALALMEASIDFPDEEDAPEKVDAPVLEKLTAIISDLETALARGNITERIREGFRIAILGKPNAGKSTLLNRLAKRDAAIVTDIPGTTRDVVEVRLIIGGYVVWLADTAGLRETQDVVEAEGVKRALTMAKQADLRIWVYDIGEGFTEWDRVQPGDLVVANKADLGETENVSRETLTISAKTDADLSILEKAVIERLKDRHAQAEAPMLTRARHRQGIEAALEHLQQAKRLLCDGYGAEFVAEDIRFAARRLAQLTGAVETEAILGEVFSSFCIGK